MKIRFLFLLFVAVGASLATAVAAVGGTDNPSAPTEQPPGQQSALVKRGAYVARLGDCMACHTTEGGKPYAGGLAIHSPLGDIYSTNITPDRQHGIGGWSEKDFARALRQGIAADGHHIYPAMPYTSYAKINDRDMHALYAYFMHGVQPVATDPPKTSLSFPFNQRWGLSVWNWLFADSKPFKPVDNASAEINRGAYLVEGLGHCGSCHTPRGFAQQQKALTNDDPVYLSGADLDNWWAPDLRGQGQGKSGIQRWSRDDVAEYLATGRNRYSAVSGEMTSVIQHSTSHMKQADVAAIAAYLKSLPAKNSKDSASPSQAAATTPDAATKHTASVLTHGQNLNPAQYLYMDNCAACHKVDGMGAGRTIPPLVGNSLANADNPVGLIHTILAGAAMPSTPRAPEALAMPNFDWRLSNDEVAKLATFVRQAWGNHGDPVTADEVAKVRKTLPRRSFSSAPADADPRTSDHHSVLQDAKPQQ